MEWKLVNVTGIRPEPFTAELIVDPRETGGYGLVGIHEKSADGNIGGGISIYNVVESDLEYTGQTVTHDPANSKVNYTPQLV